VADPQQERPEHPRDHEKPKARTTGGDGVELTDEQLAKVAGGTGVRHETAKSIVSNVRD
jgi:hypothetical protein